MEDKDRIIYYLNIEDVITVAEEDFEAELSTEEIKIIEDKVADFIDWRDAIYLAITEAFDITRPGFFKSDLNDLE
jgi:hypothetical protein